MKRILVLLALAAAVPGTPASAANGWLQPGDYMVAGNAACTTNFVFDGTGSLAGRVYLGTAAHCVTGGVGQDVADINGTVWGDVAIVGNDGAAATDWAYIEVRTAHVSRVRAFVKGHSAFPTGVTTPSETAFGDRIQVSGYGLGFDLVSVTQERRQAVLTYDDAQVHDVAGPIDFGDSGGPLVHIPTGKALGIVSRLCIGTCTETGPTVQGMLDQARLRGFTVSLRPV